MTCHGAVGPAGSGPSTGQQEQADAGEDQTGGPARAERLPVEVAGQQDGDGRP